MSSHAIEDTSTRQGSSAVTDTSDDWFRNPEVDLDVRIVQAYKASISAGWATKGEKADVLGWLESAATQANLGPKPKPIHLTTKQMIRLADAIVNVAEPYDLADLDYRGLLELAAKAERSG